MGAREAGETANGRWTTLFELTWETSFCREEEPLRSFSVVLQGQLMGHVLTWLRRTQDDASKHLKARITQK